MYCRAVSLITASWKIRQVLLSFEQSLHRCSIRLVVINAACTPSITAWCALYSASQSNQLFERPSSCDSQLCTHFMSCNLSHYGHLPYHFCIHTVALEFSSAGSWIGVLSGNLQLMAVSFPFASLLALLRTSSHSLHSKPLDACLMPSFLISRW